MRRRLRSNNTNLIKLAMLGIIAMASGFLLTSFLGSKSKTQALSATEFQAGRIIDDSIFYNPNTMTAAEIDAFIDSHSPACDMWGTQKVYGNVTRAEYVKQLRAQGYTKYHDPPFVCVSEYYENPETHKTNFETGGKKEAGMLSAGEIIYRAAHEYNVNPQVLLVMLKKESYVWGDDWPHSFQYNTVMGYACPDGAPCDSKYFGFYNQVMMAAWQLNYYREHIYSYNYRPYTTNQILYNPDRSCGSKSVYLENIATTSLYIYTPYVPNDGALANYPGTSYCGSYGNRNFYMYFREWFGNTLGDNPEPGITRRYNELRKKGIDLGEKVGELSSNGSTRIFWQEYENGFIVGNDKTGYWESMGPIREYWSKLGFESGNYGFPLGGIETNPSTGITYQQYQSGFIVGKEDTGYWESMGPIRDVWAKNGFEWGKLGFPTTAVSYDLRTNTHEQEYERGVIVGNGSKYYILSRKIYDYWKTNYTKLGSPAEDLATNSSTNISWVRFKNGYIVGNDNTGYWESMGGIRDIWARNGFEWGKLGFPLGAITYDSTSKAYSQQYERGFIVGNDSTGYYILSDGIYSYWKDNATKLGLPIDNLSSNLSTGISWVEFKNGYIVGRDSTGYWESMGGIRDIWARNGFEWGRYGFPLGTMTYDEATGTYSQAYENGTITSY